MRKYVVFAAAAASFAASLALARPRPRPPAGAAPAAAPKVTVPAAKGAGTVKDATFHSDALGVDKHYVFYLPGGYDDAATANGRYPVIYLLHGLGGSETNWTTHGGLAEAADKMHLAAIVVMPDGDDSFYSNWAASGTDYETCLKQKRPFGYEKDMANYCVKKYDYEDYIVHDLIAHVDATYRTVAGRRGRAIGGVSMGGFGALELAMRHRDVFLSAASHSGVDSLFYEGPHPYEQSKAKLGTDIAHWGEKSEPIGGLVRHIFGNEMANWERHDPATLAAKLHNGDLAIYLDCGTDDMFQLDAATAYLHDVLGAAGVTHTYYEGPGKHDFSFWKVRIGESLTFHVEQFRKAGLQM